MPDGRDMLSDNMGPGGHTTLRPGTGSCYSLNVCCAGFLQFGMLHFAKNPFGGKYFIHWTTDPNAEGFFKFDVVDRDNYNEVGYIRS